MSLTGANGMAAANEALVRDYFKVVTGEDTGKPLMDFFSNDVVWTVPQSNPMIKPNPREGLDAVMDLLTNGVDVYQPGSMSLEFGYFVADESRVVAQFTLDAVLANGGAYRNHYLFLFVVTDGKISEVFEYLDTLYQYQSGAFEGF